MADLHNDIIIGEVTTGGWGRRVQKPIALSMIKAEFNIAGTEVEKEILGERRPASF